MAELRCTSEAVEIFAGVGMAVCLAFVFGVWVLLLRPLITDWRAARRRR